MTLNECRRFFADEVRFAANVSSPELIEAFSRVPREQFLGPGPWEIASSDARGLSPLSAVQVSYTSVDDPRDLYHNVMIALDKAADINNGQPSALARWIDAMHLRRGERVYHLGSGVGYYTAIIAEVVGPQGSVVGTEVEPELVERAAKNLRAYPNVAVHAKDGAAFDPGECDAMLINAGVTHPLPLWLDRLRDGGRLVVPLTMAATPTVGVGLMTKIVRQGNGYSLEVVSPLAIYSCKSARDPEREPLMKTVMATGGFLKVKSIRRDKHERTETCALHGGDVCLSSTAPL
jgi:protein-L-isoaspartate(D-aspartate) O-methyltransferase